MLYDVPNLTHFLYLCQYQLDLVLGMTKGRSDICSIRLYVERTNTIAQQTYNNLGMHHSHYDLYEIDLTT